ncbi:hypothetical protein E2C01_066567 [Portunus trituberculatus]|uniref:Uncharacterized protein n=1 Tax=Portunus trituberculatus TaxID=210409 RepID=A0A5B7HR84_PORTR|nr:hypothetical protein [Portunus trituberculatus]
MTRRAPLPVPPLASPYLALPHTPDSSSFDLFIIKAFLRLGVGGRAEAGWRQRTRRRRSSTEWQGKAAAVGEVVVVVVVVSSYPRLRIVTPTGAPARPLCGDVQLLHPEIPAPVTAAPPPWEEQSRLVKGAALSPTHRNKPSQIPPSLSVHSALSSIHLVSPSAPLQPRLPPPPHSASIKQVAPRHYPALAPATLARMIGKLTMHTS